MTICLSVGSGAVTEISVQNIASSTSVQNDKPIHLPGQQDKPKDDTDKLQGELRGGSLQCADQCMSPTFFDAVAQQM